MHHNKLIRLQSVSTMIYKINANSMQACSSFVLWCVIKTYTWKSRSTCFALAFRTYSLAALPGISTPTHLIASNCSMFDWRRKSTKMVLCKCMNYIIYIISITLCLHCADIGLTWFYLHWWLGRAAEVSPAQVSPELTPERTRWGQDFRGTELDWTGL